MNVNIELNKKNKLSFMARQVSGRSVLGTLESNSLKGKQMQRILSLVVAALAMLASSAAFAYLEDGQVPPELTMIPVDMSFRVLDNGYGVVMVIDDTTGLPIHDQWGQECSGPAPDVSGRCASQLAFPAVAAIIIGAGTGALGVAAAGGNAGQILSGAILPDGHLKLPHLWPGQTPAPEQVAGRGEVTRLARAWQLAPRLL